MNKNGIFSGVFIFLALTLNFDFVYGGFDNMSHHSIYILYSAIVVNIIGTILKLGDRTKLGSLLVSTSIVALIQLVFAAILWSWYNNYGTPVSDSNIFSIVSIAAGALVANFLSVIVLIIEISRIKR
jgi:hypothetical protein